MNYSSNLFNACIAFIPLIPSNTNLIFLDDCFTYFNLIVVSIFLFWFFSNFSIDEITNYKFIQSNRDYFINLKNKNLIFISLIFTLLTLSSLLYTDWSGAFIDRSEPMLIIIPPFFLPFLYRKFYYKKKHQISQHLSL